MTKRIVLPPAPNGLAARKRHQDNKRRTNQHLFTPKERVSCWEIDGPLPDSVAEPERKGDTTASNHTGTGGGTE